MTADTFWSHRSTKSRLITYLHGLAMDCLQLSMHFFHPIQLCAQQVYHTAIPLSPISSLLHKHHLQIVIDNQLSHVTTFSGAPGTWGLLLRTIDTRPRQLTCITTSGQRIISACEDIVTIYDAVTGVPQQVLQAPGRVIKIQASLDGTILFFAHSFSVTMWDVQTGGLIHTFTTKSGVNDIAVSGTHIACGSSDGSVTYWNIHTRGLGRGFKNGHPVVTIYWLSPQKLAVATQGALCIHDIVNEKSSEKSIPGHVWGMVYEEVRVEFLVGTLQPSSQMGQEESYFTNIRWTQNHRSESSLGPGLFHKQSPTYNGQLSNPTLLGHEVVCITPENGVQLFNVDSHNWTHNPPLLRAATSITVSLGRYLVVQTKDSIQIFSLEVLESSESHNDLCSSHIYPLGENLIISVLQPTRHITLLKLETMQKLRPDGNISSLKSLLANQLPFVHTPFSSGLVTEFDISLAMQAWQSGTPLPEWTEADGKGVLLSGLSPKRTRTVTVYGQPQPELCVKDTKHGTILANLLLEHGDLGMGKVYDLIFDSETRFHLKIDGPEWHVEISYDVIESPLGCYSHTITKGELMPLLEPRETPPYTLDANYEWVADAESRKICWIPPGNIRRGNGGHFWVGLSLVMVGDDGVVRKLNFRAPEC